MFAIQMKEKSAENVQAYASGIFAQKRCSRAILSNNGTEVKKQFSLMHVNNMA